MPEPASTLAAEPRQPKATEQLRAANLARVLELVRHRGPIARAALTEETGLNRSTIGAVLAQLSGEGWVSALDGTAEGPGRPSPVVHVTTDRVILAISPEIDSLECAVVGIGGDIRARRVIDAEPSLSPQGYLNAAHRVLDDLLADASELTPIGVGIAVPGLVDSDGVVRNAPHLGWREVSLASAAESVFGLPARAANDAACGALAERSWGAASSASDFVFVNGGSSGIGASMFSGGSRILGANGFAGEWGHAVINARGPAHEQTLEQLVSKRRMERLLGRHFVDRFETGELARPEVRAEVDAQLDVLALGLRSLVNVCNPERIVLGGYLSALELARPGWLAGAIRDSALHPVGAGVDVRTAQLGTNAITIGAAELIAERLPVLEGGHA
ncbi:MAG TPA: ROK family protein [Microbacteriaceae bacterium]|nr:ROK family protein [Microbacteriaceae bacterium]